MTDVNSIPTIGSRIGRYLIVREVAQGTLGPLFIAERDVGDGVAYGLARVVMLPSELPPQDEQALADAIWDSTHVAHDLVLRVADVVTDTGSLSLVHEHAEGSLLEYLQACAMGSVTAFPAKVASRIALDVIEGLEQSRDYCASAGIPWRPGTVSPGSLLLGPDGRVRAMDGQITAAALRVAAMRQRAGVAAYAAPEMLDDTREPSERSDVFAVGVLLWELLTGRLLFCEQGSAVNLGRSFKVPKVAQSVPAGTKVPQGLVHTVHTALEADPLRRQSSLRELAVAIVMGVEDVSTYEQVLEFTDALLLPSTEAAPAEPASSGSATVQAHGTAASNVFTVETPGPAAVPVPAVATPVTSDPLVFSVTSAPATETNSVAAQTPASVATAEPPEEITGEQPAAKVDSPPPAPAAEAAAAVSLPSNAVAAAEASGFRDKLGTLPGHGSQGKSEIYSQSTPAASAAGQVTSLKDIVNPPPAQETGRQSAPPDANKGNTSPGAHSVPPSPFKLAEDEPVQVAVIKPVQVGESTRATPSSKPPSSKPLVALGPNEPSDSMGIPSAAPAGRTIQLSLGTVVFGILTTVLAVVVIMLVLQRSNKPDVAPVASIKPGTPAAQPAAMPQGLAPRASAVDPTGTVVPAGDTSEMAQSPAGKADHHKHGLTGPGKPGGKSGPNDTDNHNTDSKQPEQPSKGHFIPNEL